MMEHSVAEEIGRPEFMCIHPEREKALVQKRVFILREESLGEASMLRRQEQGGSARCGSKTVESARPDLAAGGQGISVFDFLCPTLSVGTRVQAMAGILRKERGKTVAPGRKRRDEKEDIPDGVCSEMACRGKAERPVLIVRPVVIPFSIDRSEREEGFFLSVF